MPPANRDDGVSVFFESRFDKYQATAHTSLQKQKSWCMQWRSEQKCAQSGVVVRRSCVVIFGDGIREEGKSWRKGGDDR